MLTESEFFLKFYEIGEKYLNDENRQLESQFEKEISEFLKKNIDFLNKYKKEIIDKDEK